MNTKLSQKAKKDFEKDFWQIMQFLEKLFKMWEKIEILNLKQHKGEEIIQHQNQIIILQSFSQKIY